MLRRIHLKGVGPAPEMGLELAPRLNLLTGDNGLGKSFLLDIAWWALTGDWAGRPAWPDPSRGAHPLIEYWMAGQERDVDFQSHFIFQENRWKDLDPMRSPSIVLYAHVDGRFSVWDSARNSWWPGAPDKITRGLDRPYHFSTDSLLNGLTEQGRVLCEGLVRDWISWQRQETESFQQLRQLLRVLSPGEEERLQPGRPVRLSLEDVRDHPTLEMPYGTIPIVLASAGMQRVISLAYLLVWVWQEHVRVAELLHRDVAKRIVFLIDEAEAHLHPKWQRLLLPALLSVASSLGSQAEVQIIATTHSPLVLASVEPVFQEGQDKLIHLRLEGHEVRIEDLPWAKQGDAANWLVSEVFGLHQARSKEAERAIEAAEAWMRGDFSVLPKELGSREAIHAELVRVLAGHDDFWPRWIVALENAVASGAQRR